MHGDPGDISGGGFEFAAVDPGADLDSQAPDTVRMARAPAPPAPGDSKVARNLLARLHQGQDVTKIARFLECELREQFGLDPGPSDPHEFALRLVNWLQSRS